MNQLLQVLFCFFIAVSVCLAGSPETRLVLVGGGATPEAAIEYLVKAGGANHSKILVITWAANPLLPEDQQSQSPSTFEKIKSRFSVYPIASIVEAPKRAELMANKLLPELKDKINSSSVIFFSGGDQDFIMQVLSKHPQIKELLKKKFKEGIPFGGTSAGTAIMSDLMITSEEEIGLPQKFRVKSGLGLLPENWVADQHFDQREGRKERMVAVLTQDPKYFDRWDPEVLKKYRNKKNYGLGVYESCAFLVLDGKTAEALGPNSYAELFTPNSPNTPLKVGPGKQIDLLSGKTRELSSHSRAAASHQ